VARIYYIGDEATAAGYRLAGVETRTPAADETAEVFRRARADGADMVLLAAAAAHTLDAEELATAILAERPLVAIVPDVNARHAPPDVDREVRLALGIES
jgi:vacuolar-type H+-ATPase subunit F/Vma7